VVSACMSGTSVEGGDVFRVIQLAGPTAREAEEQVAKYIEEQVALYDQRDLGARTRRDGNCGLRIDFTYDAAMPPVAMEITALVQPDLRALGTELLKLEAELQEVVCSEDLGAWLVSVRVGTDVRLLRPPLIELLRRQRTRSGIVLFRAGEAPGDLTESDRRLLTELLDLGLFSAMRLDQGNQVSVSPPISNDAEGDDGFGAQLRAAMAANVDKLREARPRETHLVVTLDRFDLSADPARTPVPDLLEGIDVLWILLGYYNAKWTYRVWRTMTGDPRWQLLADPLGEPPAVYPSATPRDQPPPGA
jgi:hypothetical protein